MDVRENDIYFMYRRDADLSRLLSADRLVPTTDGYTRDGDVYREERLPPVWGRDRLLLIRANHAIGFDGWYALLRYGNEGDRIAAAVRLMHFPMRLASALSSDLLPDAEALRMLKTAIDFRLRTDYGQTREYRMLSERLRSFTGKGRPTPAYSLTGGRERLPTNEISRKGDDHARIEDRQK